MWVYQAKFSHFTLNLTAIIFIISRILLLDGHNTIFTFLTQFFFHFLENSCQVDYDHIRGIVDWIRFVIAVIIGKILILQGFFLLGLRESDVLVSFADPTVHTKVTPRGVLSVKCLANAPLPLLDGLDLVLERVWIGDGCFPAVLLLENAVDIV